MSWLVRPMPNKFTNNLSILMVINKFINNNHQFKLNSILNQSKSFNNPFKLLNSMVVSTNLKQLLKASLEQQSKEKLLKESQESNMFLMKRQLLNMKLLKELITFQRKRESLITMQLNIRPNTFLKSIKIDILNTFPQKEFKKEFNIKPSKSKLCINQSNNKLFKLLFNLLFSSNHQQSLFLLSNNSSFPLLHMFKLPYLPLKQFQVQL